MERLKVKRFRDVKLPTRTHESDAGLDLYAPEDIVIPFGRRVKVPSGIGVALPEGTVGLLFDRSSMGDKGIRTLGGVVDANYRGEISVILAYVAGTRLEDGSIPLGEDYVDIKRGDKIAQFIITAAYTPEVLEVAEFETTDRGSKGFGSSGR